MYVIQITGTLQAACSSGAPHLGNCLSLWVCHLGSKSKRQTCFSLPLGFIRARHFSTDFHFLHCDSSSTQHGAVTANENNVKAPSELPGRQKHALKAKTVDWLVGTIWLWHLYRGCIIITESLEYGEMADYLQLILLSTTKNKIFLILEENWTILKSWALHNPIEMQR